MRIELRIDYIILYKVLAWCFDAVVAQYRLNLAHMALRLGPLVQPYRQYKDLAMYDSPA